jgi:hypothetical protein
LALAVPGADEISWRLMDERRIGGTTTTGSVWTRCGAETVRYELRAQRSSPVVWDVLVDCASVLVTASVLREVLASAPDNAEAAALLKEIGEPRATVTGRVLNWVATREVMVAPAGLLVLLAGLLAVAAVLVRPGCVS